MSTWSSFYRTQIGHATDQTILDARLLALAVSDVTLRPSTETAVAPQESAGATA